MSEKTTIVILGGGYGGVKAAKVLYKKFKSDKNIEITLIDQNPFHTLMTELHEVAGGRATPDSVQVSFRKIFGGRCIHIITDKVTLIDFSEKKITSSNGNVYRYDYLALGVGSEPAFYGIPGIKENSFKLWSYDDAVLLHNHILDTFTLASRESNPEKRKELLTFVVAGAGLTGIEIAGELVEWRPTLCTSYGISEKEVRIIIVEALDAILPALPESLRKKSEKFLIKTGAEICIKSSITGCDGNTVKIKGSNDISTHTLIWTCGVQACELGAHLNLKKGNMHSLRIETNDFMQSIEHQEVYVTGDVSWHIINGNPIPQIVETALQSGKIAAQNIIADIKGTTRKKFNPKYHGIMASIGGHFAVANIMNIRMSGFPAMMMKHLVNLHYLFEIAGLNAVWNYIQHHFLDVKNGRSITGNNLSFPFRIYWIGALRIFLGIMWLVSGINRLHSGSIDASIIAIFPWMTNESLSYLQLVIGGSLLLGFFTFAFSILSIGLAAALGIFTGMMSSYIWCIAVSAVMLGGAGRCFGLDQWIMPALKKWWNRRSLAKLTYLYFDEPGD